MIQFNLLPDVKQEFVKARRTKRLVILISIAVSGFSLFVLLLFILNVKVVQTRTLNGLSKDITTDTNKLKAIPNIDKILTVQNQLNTISGLHDSSPEGLRLFSYLGQLTPTNVTISSVAVDFTASTVTLSGNATALSDVNSFIDTLKNTKYQQEGATGTLPYAFSKVVLSSFSVSDKATTYSTTFSFDPLIFDIKKNAVLKVPSSTVTNTSNLFKAGN